MLHKNRWLWLPFCAISLGLLIYVIWCFQIQQATQDSAETKVQTTVSVIPLLEKAITETIKDLEVKDSSQRRIKNLNKLEQMVNAKEKAKESIALLSDYYDYYRDEIGLLFVLRQLRTEELMCSLPVRVKREDQHFRITAVLEPILNIKEGKVEVPKVGEFNYKLTVEYAGTTTHRAFTNDYVEAPLVMTFNIKNAVDDDNIFNVESDRDYIFPDWSKQ